MIDSKKAWHVGVTTVKHKGVEIVIRQVGKHKVIISHGRGSVRNAKQVARTMHKLLMEK